MPKVGMEPVRKKALIHATIATIGEVGTLDVTVTQIARRAGMSSALAHHYFGSKEQIFLATMRFIMREYGETVRRNLKGVNPPEERLYAIINSSFDSSQFEREVVAAWLNFYVLALRSEPAARLLEVYARRLQSNLMHELRQLFPEATAREISQGLASLIDGFYVRSALQESVPDKAGIRAVVTDYLTLWLERTRRGDD